ncbi:MAG: hypothetical protein GC136_06015 [Alphaproteobacteria bacterium]|nr:hypothetical protein [Alphaproteobacteria bacterium]
MSDSNLKTFTGEVIDVASHVRTLYNAARQNGFTGNVREFMADQNLSRLAVKFESAVGFGMRTEVGAFINRSDAKNLKLKAGQKVSGEAVLLDAGCFVRKFN